MVALVRAEGNWAGDLDLTRRSIALALATGYAVAAFSADAQPIHTDSDELIATTVQIPVGDREIPAYMARPASDGRRPAIFVYSEIFGVHEWVKDICRRLAKAGYVAVAPDFFVRAGDPSTTRDMEVIMKIVSQSSDAQVTSDSRAVLRWLKAQRYVDGRRLGVTGFCWGGGKTWLAAERFPDFKAAVAWYGPLRANSYPQTPPLELVKSLRVPVLGLYAGNDRGISAEDIEAMRAAIAAARKRADIVVYPNVQHGFLADYRQSYDAAAAEDGWKRMLAFFAGHGLAA